MLATEDFRRGVVLSLVSDVAQAYFSLQELDLELEIARRTTESFDETDGAVHAPLPGRRRLEAVGRARQGGALRRPRPPSRSSSSRSSSRRTSSASLLGRPPGPIARAADADPGGGAAADAARAAVASCCERRPDILQAEQQIASRQRAGRRGGGELLPAHRPDDAVRRAELRAREHRQGPGRDLDDRRHRSSARSSRAAR